MLRLPGRNGASVRLPTELPVYAVRQTAPTVLRRTTPDWAAVHWYQTLPVSAGHPATSPASRVAPVRLAVKPLSASVSTAAPATSSLAGPVLNVPKTSTGA